jgi:hypothetical protein
VKNKMSIESAKSASFAPIFHIVFKKRIREIDQIQVPFRGSILQGGCSLDFTKRK